MKRYIYNFAKFAGLLTFSALILFSCKTWIDTDINTDPDAPADVPMNLLLPAIEQAAGYNLCGTDFVRTTNIWMQQFDGVTRQSYTEARYQLLPGDVNNIWNLVYTNIFMNTKILIDKAENTEGAESPYNAGVGKVLMATALGVATDLFGDMPYSEALMGDENVLTPAFDAQETLYTTIQSLLDDAIADLGKPASENNVDIGGDVIYDGTVANWAKAANSIKARHLLQLTKVNGNAAYTAALAAAANGFKSNADDMVVPWEEANHNPIFQFMEQRTDIRMGATLIDMMAETSDPRLPFYAEEDEDGEYRGSVIGSQDETASYPGEYLAGSSAPTTIMSYAELKFIEAEANYVLGNGDEALAAFTEGVKASVTKVTGDFDQDWFDTNIGSQTLSLELILKQKYIATVGTTQAYADYRRIGLPNITPHPGGVLPAMPTRYPYPQDEISYNGSNVPSVTISDKLWWDK